MPKSPNGSGQRSTDWCRPLRTSNHRARLAGRPSGVAGKRRDLVGRPTGHSRGYTAKREKIIDTAVELFAKKGFAATGIQELADRAGMAKGALYDYIGSKEAILIEIQRRVLEPLLTAAR